MEIFFSFFGGSKISPFPPFPAAVGKTNSGIIFFPKPPKTPVFELKAHTGAEPQPREGCALPGGGMFSAGPPPRSRCTPCQPRRCPVIRGAEFSLFSPRRSALPPSDALSGGAGAHLARGGGGRVGPCFLKNTHTHPGRG